MGGEISKVETEQQLVVAGGAKRSEFLRNLLQQYGLEHEDYYSLFELDRYCKVDAQVTEKIKHKFHELMLMWHPDKNQYKDQKECHSWTVYIKFGREVLLDPDLKRRYDLELKRQTKEADHWSSAEWYCKWGFNLVAMAGGIALIVSGCLVPAAFLGTAIAGSALLMTGVNGTATMIRDADCSIEEYAKSVGVGAAVGAAGGALTLAGAGAVAGVAGAAKVVVAAGMGAATTTTCQILSDGVDLAISEGWAGEHLRQNVIAAKTKDEIFSMKNAIQLGATAVVGATMGAAVQGIASAVSSHANASTFIDDAANVGAAIRRNVPPELQAAEMIPKFLSGFGAHTALNFNSVRDRVKQMAPEVCHNLVSDASEADFILSRTNQQKEFADEVVCNLLREGMKLCADNSLEGGWGGVGWVEKFVQDAKKTRYGILVLENGESFFKSDPCCLELYAASKAKVNLTKVHGGSITNGQYMWVLITEETFKTEKEYERTMRRKHGVQYTPFHYKAQTSKGHAFTYYCIVPTGRAARATGADKQQFPAWQRAD